MQRSRWNFNYPCQVWYWGSVQELCFAKNKTSCQLWLQQAQLFSHLSRTREIRFKRKALQSSMKLFGQGDVGLQYSLGQAFKGFQLAQLVSSLPLSDWWGFKPWNFNGVERLVTSVFRAFICHSGVAILICPPGKMGFVLSMCRISFNTLYLI